MRPSTALGAPQLGAVLVASLLMACAAEAKPPAADPRGIPYAAEAPVLDGRADESSWSVADWHPLSHVLVGTPVSDEADFSGRYRLLWREDALYLLAEIRDDVLSDGSADPLLDYWADDALEILIDEDASGGGHKANHSAFAYHIALDGEVVDMGEDGQPLRLIEHVESTWRRSPAAPHSLLWEARIRIYPDPAALTPAADWQPRALKASEIMGFSLAYCDSDAPGERRRLIADVEVEAVDGDRNRLYLDAGVFGRIALLP